MRSVVEIDLDVVWLRESLVGVLVDHVVEDLGRKCLGSLGGFLCDVRSCRFDSSWCGEYDYLFGCGEGCRCWVCLEVFGSRLVFLVSSGDGNRVRVNSVCVGEIGKLILPVSGIIVSFGSLRDGDFRLVDKFVDKTFLKFSSFVVERFGNGVVC
jgi:hypothetical protein